MNTTRTSVVKKAYSLPALTLTLLAFSPLQAEANYTASLAGAVATLTGDADADTLIVYVSAGNLAHNRFGAGDPGFASATDWDSTDFGIQTVANGPGVAVNINAGNGADAITLLNKSRMVNLISVRGQVAADTLTIDASSGAVGETATITSTTVTGLGGQVIYDTLEALRVECGDGSDTINVRSTLLTTPLTLNPGGAGDTITVGSSPGNQLDPLDSDVIIEAGTGSDTLTINDQGETDPQTYTLSVGSIQRGGLDITYGVTVDGLVLNAGSDNDVIQIRGVPGLFDLVVNGGTGGDTIDIGNLANTLDDIATPTDLTINGNAGTDVLNINNQGDNTSDTFTVTATNVQTTFGVNIDYSTIQSLVLNAGTNADIIRVRDTTSFTTVVVNAGGGVDQIDVGSAANSLDGILALVTVNGGTGADTLNVNDQGDANGNSYVVASTGVHRTGGTVQIDYSNMQSVVVNGSGNDNAFLVASTQLATPVRVNAGFGNDTVSVGSFLGNSLDDILGTVTVHGGLHTVGDTLNVNDQGDGTLNSYLVTSASVSRNGIAPIQYQMSVENLIVNAGTNHDTINIQSSQPGTLVVVNAGTGDDAVSLDSNGAEPDGSLILIRSSVTVNGEPGADTLVLQDTDDASPDTATVTASQVGEAAGDNLFGGSGSVTYSSLSSMTLNMGSGSDAVNVRGTAPGTSVIVNAGLGNDAFTVDSNGPAVADGTVDTVVSSVSLNGGADVDSLTLQDTSDATGDVITVANTSAGAEVGDSFFGAGGSLSFLFIQTLTVHLGAGGDTVSLRPISDVSPTLNAGGGNDVISVDSNGPAAGGTVAISVALTIDGGIGSNTLALQDSGDGSADTVTVTPSQVGAGLGDNFFAVGGSLTHNNLALITFSMGSADDTMYVTPSALTAFTFDGGAAAGDALYIDAECLPAIKTAVSVTVSSRQTISYAAVELVVVSRSSAIAPTGQDFPDSGGTGGVNVMTSAGCAWTAVSNAVWITVTSGSNGVGAGAVAFSVSANPQTSPRTGTLTIAGSIVTVTQAALSVRPTLTVNDASVAEGNAGTITATFTLTLSAAVAFPVTVDVATADGSAVAPGDYTAVPTTSILFPAGITTRTVSVSVNGDTLDEPVESYFVNLSNAGNATIADAQGAGTITDEDLTVTITSPTGDPTTSAPLSFLAMAGSAADAGGIANVTWVNDRGGSGTAVGTTSWSIPDVPLAAGVNVITITARDIVGNTNTDTLTVTVTTLVYYLAEGATGAFFDLDLLLANPTATPAPVSTTFLKDDGTTVVDARVLAPMSRTTIRVDDIPGLGATAVSTVVTSTSAIPIVVERSMYWNASYYGGHAGSSVASPATTWLFGEGSQGFFDTYVLLANANAGPANVTVTFLLEFEPPVIKNYTVAGTSRFNVFAGAIPELVDRSFSIVVTSDVPIIAERAMYFGAPLFNGGHESTGVNAASTTWFHAEGATGSYFDTYILVGNPNAAPATVTFTFLLDSGVSITKVKTIPGNTRLTVNVEHEDAQLANAAVSTTVTSDLPVISERAMYWPGPVTTWFEAHNSFGVTQTATKWGLAEGRSGGPFSFQTYILLANPSTTTAANVQITYLKTDGTTVVKNYMVNPTTRFNVDVNAVVPELAGLPFGALIEVTNGVPIAVERALYNDAGGVVWAAGTNATAVRVP